MPHNAAALIELIPTSLNPSRRLTCRGGTPGSSWCNSIPWLTPARRAARPVVVWRTPQRPTCDRGAEGKSGRPVCLSVCGKNETGSWLFLRLLGEVPSRSRSGGARTEDIYTPSIHNLQAKPRLRTRFRRRVCAHTHTPLSKTPNVTDGLYSPKRRTLRLHGWQTVRGGATAGRPARDASHRCA